MSEYNTIIVEQRGAVTLVTLNRPQALNALNSEVLKELIQLFAAYDADESQHCLVLTGSEKAFAAGADIKEMQPQGFADMYSANFFAGWEQVTSTRKPWIAAVAGYALGGGCEVAMMADMIIAADSARFGQLVEESLKTAETIASMAPLAAMAVKEMVNAAFEMPLAQGIRFERRLFHGLFGTEDQKEGMTAFVEKRPGN